MPSITRMVGRCTRIGGSRTSLSASVRRVLLVLAAQPRTVGRKQLTDRQLDDLGGRLQPSGPFGESVVATLIGRRPGRITRLRELAQHALVNVGQRSSPNSLTDRPL